MNAEVWDATGKCIDCQKEFELPRAKIGDRVRCKSCYGAWRNEGCPDKNTPIPRSHPGESKAPWAAAIARAVELNKDNFRKINR
jgi:hypothetical protein